MRESISQMIPRLNELPGEPGIQTFVRIVPERIWAVHETDLDLDMRSSRESMALPKQCPRDRLGCSLERR